MTLVEAIRQAKEMSALLKLRYYVVQREDGTYAACSQDAYNTAIASGNAEKLIIIERHIPEGI